MQGRVNISRRTSVLASLKPRAKLTIRQQQIDVVGSDKRLGHADDGALQRHLTCAAAAATIIKIFVLVSATMTEIFQFKPLLLLFVIVVIIRFIWSTAHASRLAACHNQQFSQTQKETYSPSQRTLVQPQPHATCICSGKNGLKMRLINEPLLCSP